MLSIDPISLIITNNLVTLVVTLVLLASRIGLGTAGPGMRTWILGDVCVAVGRTILVLAVTQQGFVHAWSWTLAASALGMAGLVAHYLAVRRVSGHVTSHRRAVGAMLGLAAVYVVPASLVVATGPRVAWLHLLIGAMAVLMLKAAWPLRRHYGARLIMAVMGLAVLYNGASLGRLAAVAFHAEAEPLARILLAIWIDLVITLVLSASFLLLMQERLRERIERLVVTDPLTGVLNRHGLMPLLQRELAHAGSGHPPVSVALFDLDHFKRVNDQHGHAAGDAVLAGFAARVMSNLRGGDLFGRWGGEEFLLVLPNTGLDEACHVAQKVRQVVASAPLSEGTPAVTVSGGVACSGESTEVRARLDTLLGLLEEADRRLYRAKQQRNAVFPPLADRKRLATTTHKVRTDLDTAASPPQEHAADLAG
jgi:diguanylate cyclase (GGDEF)-like protein